MGDEPDALSLDAFYDHAPVGYLSVLADGTVGRVNDTLLAWTGYTREYVLDAKPFVSLLTIGGQIFYETHCVPLLLGGQAIDQMSLEVRCADGSTIPVLFAAHVHATAAEGRPEVIRMTIINVAARRAFMQELVTRNDELARSNEEYDTFAHAAAHDLRAPLRGIRMATEFLIEDTQGQLPPGAEDELHGVVHLAERMSRMLDDLLTYAQGGSGAWHAEPVGLRAAVAEVVELLGERAQEARIDVDDVRLQADPVVLRQLLLNLVGNAVKYSPEPARVAVSVTTVERAATLAAVPGTVADFGPDSRVLVVADEGIGISAEHFDHVFGLFRQLDPAADGSGTGLALCRLIARRRGGDIWLTSAPGQGTTFFVLIP